MKKGQQQDRNFKGAEYTEVSIAGKNKSNVGLIQRFINEFFYDTLLENENTLDKNVAVIKDGANDIFYELKDFSKEFPDTLFNLRFINRHNRKTKKLFHIKNGECKEVKEAVKPKIEKKETQEKTSVQVKKRMKKENKVESTTEE